MYAPHCWWHVVRRARVVRRVWCRLGGYTGWVPGRVIPGPARGRPTSKAEDMTAKRAPEAPGRGWSGWSCLQRPGTSGTTLRARSGTCGTLPVPPRANPASWPIKARFHVFSVNLVKTAECHQKMSKRPSIVPISKTRAKSHLLIFSDFRFRWPSLTRN